MKGELQRRLGSNLRRQRISLGLSQEKLAEIWGYNAKYVSRLETGNCNVTLRTLEHLAGLAGEADPVDLLRSVARPS